MNKVRTRFAPSPTGYMHIGNLRTALFAYLIAKKNGGDFILRIEDTDQERYVEGAVETIYKTLKDCGLNWDEGPDIGGPVGPYIQSQRMGMFKDYALKLIESGHAYYCFCDKERLDEVKKIQEASHIAPMYDRHCRNLSKEEVQEKLDAGIPYVIRQKMPLEGTTTFHDEVYGDITVENVILEHLKPVTAKLREAGCEVIEMDKSIRVIGPEKLKAVDIKTLPHPGFPTDVQAQFMAMLTVSKGTGVVIETVFENRFMHVAEFNRMGANIKIEGRSAIVEGVEKLYGAKVNATDLRAGAALILCGLIAEGETEIGEIYHIQRGYVDIDKKITALGGNIEIIE